MFGRRVLSRNETRMARLGMKPSIELSLIETIEILERKHSTWGRAEVVEALTVVLPTRHVKSADSYHRTVEACADLVLAHADVVQLTCPDRPEPCHGAVGYSTWWTLQMEQALLDTVEAGRQAEVAVVATHPILAQTCLPSDQNEAARRLCGAASGWPCWWGRPGRASPEPFRPPEPPRTRLASRCEAWLPRRWRPVCYPSRPEYRPRRWPSSFSTPVKVGSACRRAR